MPNHKPFHARPIEEVLKFFSTSEKNGLDVFRVQHLQEELGFNEIDEQELVPWWKKLLAQFNNYLVWILVVGALISLVAGEYVDGGLILAIILFMAILGYIQDAKAEESLKNLKKLESHHTQVLRDGTVTTVETREIVPGDIVILKAGDAIPADVRIIEENNASVHEATLTGESLPTSKKAGVLEETVPLAEQTNMAFSGTLLIEGKMIAVVVATGMQTELGKIATLLQETKSEPTPLEQQLEKLGKLISVILLGLVLLVLFLNVFVRGESLLVAVLESVALAIAAVPEGLPAVITICLAFGTQVMVKKQALVRKLKSVEALGSVSVILTDKTGTITSGTMSVTDVWTSDKLIAKKNQHTEVPLLLGKMLRVARYCNTQSNPTDIALWDWASESAVALPEMKHIFEYEFNSAVKRMTTISTFVSADQKKKKDTYLVATKGAPEILLPLISGFYGDDNTIHPMSPAVKKKVEQQLVAMTSQGLRVIALTERKLSHFKKSDTREDVENKLTLVGLIGLSDPAKAEVPEAIALAKKAGILPIMMTGDNPITAKTIGVMVGLITKKEAASKNIVMIGADIDEAIASGKTNKILTCRIFARVSPSHKSYIVDLFQSAGHLVAMVGDGVNDAPSLKAAHVGVAMGQRGSDVTKSAADLVLLDDNYSTLIDAIQEGRFILQRIRLFVGYLLSCNFAEIGIFVVATLMGVPMPLTAIMLLLINIVTDAAPAIAMSREPGDELLMSQPPRGKNESIITKRMWGNIAAMTVAATVVVMISYLIGLNFSVSTAQTMAFVTLSMTELFRAFTARSLDRTAFSLGLKNKWIVWSVVFGTAVTLLVAYFGGSIFKTVQLPIDLLLFAVGLAVITPVVEDAIKITVVKK